MNKISSGRWGAGARMGALAGMLLILGAGPLRAQGSDTNSVCALRGKDTVLASGARVKACLNLEELAGKTVVIPQNVNRIDNTGFSLCESSETQGGVADIVYVMDQSGSMNIRYVWIAPDKSDTLYLESVTNNGCNITGTERSAADNGLYGRITLPRDAGTRDYPLLNPAKRPAGCNSSGDPFAARALAFKEAIDFQAARAPTSHAGYVGFAGSVIDRNTPRPLNSAENISGVKANITPKYQDNTNYLASLQDAKRWLLNPVYSPNPQKAVIFLSDGRPTVPNGTAHEAVLDPNDPTVPGVMPPVYGIFMGSPSTDTARMFEIAQRTGGKFFLIPPDRPDSLRSVVEDILNLILKQFQPNSATVRHSTKGQVATAGPTDFARQENGTWQIRFDRTVDLDTQVANPIEMTSSLREVGSGELKPKNASFILSATGPRERINMNLPGTQFSVVCQDLPPDINVVKVAYIRDTDGDGAGDKVFFVFSRPLQALPATIDEVYWNKVGPEFKNKVPPKSVEFLPGSNQTVVVADFTSSPFPKGLTAIPAGEKPVGVLPAGGVFQAQRPAINDSIGPIIDSGLARPYDPAKASAGGTLNMDTLVIHLSERMRANGGFNEMLLWGKPVNGQCNDYANAKPVVSAKNPEPGAAPNTLVFYVQNGAGGPTPLVGDCIYLKDNGDYVDMPGNLPSRRGIQLRGRRPPREIELMRGYPPVVGYDADNPGFILVNNDPRQGGGNDFSKPNDRGKFEIVWVPPVGFVEGLPFAPLLPASPGAVPVGNEVTVAQPLPRTISTLQIVSTGKYIADVTIFDTQGRFMKSFRQAFGYQGELTNGARVANKGLVSYLVWDMKDSKGQKAGQGVYIWKVLFTFENNKQEIQYTRTGVMRNIEWFWKP